LTMDAARQWLFPPFRLDLDNACLWRGDQLIPLKPKDFAVLHQLVAHAGRLVTQDALFTAVWPETPVGDAVLKVSIAGLRKALGDTAKAPRFIATVHRRGYRFIVAVEEHPDTPSEAVDTDRRGPSEATQVPTGEAFAGALLPPAPAELKPVTVLCCAPDTGPAVDAHQIPEFRYRRLSRLYTLAEPIVRQHGGTLQPLVGDHLLVVFGVPAAQEDHAQQAVLAALNLQPRPPEPGGRGRGQRGEVVTVRIGLHSGVMAVGGIGHGPAMAAAVVGDAVPWAVALQEHAAPGTILCSQATARLVHRVVRVATGDPVPVPGLPTPVATYTVLGRRLQRRLLGLQGRRVRTPFVGRRHELATLQAPLARAEVGHGQVVGVVGEPGMGKSRLVYEFHRRLRKRRVAYLATHCLAHGAASPYLPIVALLRQMCGLGEGDAPATIAAKVYASLQELGPEPERRAPYLLHLLGVSVGTEPIAELSPEALRARTREALVLMARQGARRRPLVLVVEDLHWIDPSCEEVLAALVDNLPGSRLLLLLTYRPGYRPPWIHKSYATQVALAGLSQRDSRRIVQAVIRTESVRQPAVQAILARAEGNPLFLEELARAAVEQGDFHPAVELPATVQAVLAARIDRLPPEEKHLLQTAAVIGREVPLLLLRNIAEVPEEPLSLGLTHLQTAEFLHESRLFPAIAYRFKHALTQQVAYETLLRERRRALPARVVKALAGIVGTRVAEQVEYLAHHALRGEMWEQALTYCREAGEKALARSAHREAVESFEQALSALDHLPETRDTQEQAIDVRLALSSALRPLGYPRRIVTALREAEALAAALDDSRRLAQISVFLSRHFFFVGAYDQAIGSGQRAFALATAAGDAILPALANLRLGLAYRSQGDYLRAIEAFGQTVVCLEGTRRGERFGMVFLPAVLSRAALAACHAELGTFGEGRALGEEGLCIAETADHPGSVMYACWGIGLLSLRQGNLPRALPLLERAVHICQEAELPGLFPEMAAALGAAYTLAGQVADAVPLLTQAVAQTTATEREVYQALCRLALGEAQLRSGHLEEAQDLARRALTLARAHQERASQAYALSLLGDLAEQCEPPKSALAEAQYRQALALAKELGMRPFQAHCHRGLGTLYAKIGPPEQAYTELVAAIDLYRAMEMTLWLPQAETAAAQIEGREA
jgi:DNA-binding winged helix-turn-helix (wHTH) protein/tetratricopeptide (TPR) repeat protein